MVRSPALLLKVFSTLIRYGLPHESPRTSLGRTSTRRPPGRCDRVAAGVSVRRGQAVRSRGGTRRTRRLWQCSAVAKRRHSPLRWGCPSDRFLPWGRGGGGAPRRRHAEAPRSVLVGASGTPRGLG